MGDYITGKELKGLKPCPFCGRKDKLVWSCGAMYRPYRIACHNCWSRGPDSENDGTTKQAKRRWNKRAHAVGSLARIAEIIETVDNRAMAADGPVTPTLQEMEPAEMLEIYRLATGAK